MSHNAWLINDSPWKDWMVIIVSISIIVTILIRNRVMKQLGVTTVQLFLKVPSALLSAEIFQSHGYFERTKKRISLFLPRRNIGCSLCDFSRLLWYRWGPLIRRFSCYRGCLGGHLMNWPVVMWFVGLLWCKDYTYFNFSKCSDPETCGTNGNCTNLFR